MTGRLLAAAAAGLLAGTPPVQQGVFRSYADAVALDVLVTQGNRPVAGLTASDFEVTDNGVRQRILDVSRETRLLDVTLAIDVSGSIDAGLAASLARAVNRVRTRLAADDRATLVTFNRQVRERIPLTAAGSVGEIRLERRVGATSLNDAIAVALTSEPATNRRQMAIVFTDGVDTMSYLSEAAVLEVARQSRTAVFVVAAEDGGLNRGAPRRQNRALALAPPLHAGLPRAFFDELTAATGGMVQIVPRFNISRGSGRLTLTWNQNLVDDAFLRALEDFRTSYVVRYAPDGVTRTGWHEVGVRVTKRGRYQVRARRGYTIAR
jgi:VWFA-related protein